MDCYLEPQTHSPISSINKSLLSLPQGMIEKDPDIKQSPTDDTRSFEYATRESNERFCFSKLSRENMSSWIFSLIEIEPLARQKYADIILNEYIDGSCFMELRKEDLVRLGFNSDDACLIHRHKSSSLGSQKVVRDKMALSSKLIPDVVNLLEKSPGKTLGHSQCSIFPRDCVSNSEKVYGELFVFGNQVIHKTRYCICTNCTDVDFKNVYIFSNI